MDVMQFYMVLPSARSLRKFCGCCWQTNFAVRKKIGLPAEQRQKQIHSHAMLLQNRSIRLRDTFRP